MDTLPMVCIELDTDPGDLYVLVGDLGDQGGKGSAGGGYPSAY